MSDQQAELDWTEGAVPVSRRFDDPYFSLAGGLAETGHVFLAGNDLPGRFRNGFHIAELGFGSGLNLIAAALAWRETRQARNEDAILQFTSFEAWPMAASDRSRALSLFPGLEADVERLNRALALGPGPHDLEGGIRLTVIHGDVRETLPRWTGQADAWFLDGFSPAKNPEMWEEGVMRQVASHLAPGGTFATYTAAGHVRRALEGAGLAVERCPGFGRKRHMTRGGRP